MLSGAEIHRRLSVQYGNSVLPQRSVYEWIEKFKNVRTSVTHEEGAGRSSTATADDNFERVRDMVLLDRRLTINEVANRLQIIGRLKPEIRSKRRGQLSKCNVLLHDNSRPLTDSHTVETLQKLNFEVLAHPPYSPDLAPSDYHLFGPLKEALRGRRFTSDQELKEAVHAWLAAQKKKNFLRTERSLCNDGRSALKSKETMLKNDVIISFLFLLKIKVCICSAVNR